MNTEFDTDLTHTNNDASKTGTTAQILELLETGDRIEAMYKQLEQEVNYLERIIIPPKKDQLQIVALCKKFPYNFLNSVFKDAIIYIKMELIDLENRISALLYDHDRLFRMISLPDTPDQSQKLFEVSKNQTTLNSALAQLTLKISRLRMEQAQKTIPKVTTASKYEVLENNIGIISKKISMLVPKVEHELAQREKSLVQTSLDKVKAARKKFARTKVKIDEEQRDFRKLLESQQNQENKSLLSDQDQEFQIPQKIDPHLARKAHLEKQVKLLITKAKRFTESDITISVKREKLRHYQNFLEIQHRALQIKRSLSRTIPYEYLKVYAIKPCILIKKIWKLLKFLTSLENETVLKEIYIQSKRKFLFCHKIFSNQIQRLKNEPLQALYNQHYQNCDQLLEQVSMELLDFETSPDNSANSSNIQEELTTSTAS